MLIATLPAVLASASPIHLASVLIGVTFLGVVMAVSPTTFGIELDVEMTSKTARRAVGLIARAVAAGATFLALVFTAVSPATIDAIWKGSVGSLVAQHWLDLVVGGAVLVVGLVRWRAASEPRRPKRRHGSLDEPRVLVSTVFANTVIGSSSVTTMYLVVRTIGSTPPAFWAIAYATFLAALAAPYLLIGLLWSRSPRFSQSVTRMMSDLARRDLRREVAGGLIAVGLALVVWSVASLAGAS